MSETATDPDPFAWFARWMEEAARSEPNDPNAMTLATATPDGRPSARIVLLKGYDERGFVFYTNTQSRKGTERAANPRAALLFHWKSLGRQVRIEGATEPVTAAEVHAARRAYAAEVAYFDDNVGRVLAALRAARLE